MNTLSTGELQQRIDNNDDFLLINTLPPDDFKTTNIPGSLNIPENRDDFVEQVKTSAGGKEKPVVVYCASKECNSSTSAAEKLKDAGFEEVYDYEGGAEAWRKAGKEITITV